MEKNETMQNQNQKKKWKKKKKLYRYDIKKIHERIYVAHTI